MTPSQQIRFANLEWYLSEGLSLFFRSPSGHTYETLKNRAYDSSGADLRKQYAELDPWTVMSVNEDTTHHGTYTVDETLVLKFSKVGKWIAQVRAQDLLAVRVLEIYYGDRGAWCGSAMEDGRIVSIYHLTRTGKRWVAALRAQSPFKLEDEARLTNEKLSQKQNPNDLRRMRFKKVDDEARILLRDAQKLFLEASRVD